MYKFKILFFLAIFSFVQSEIYLLKLRPYKNKNLEMSLSKNFLTKTADTFKINSFIESGTAKGETTNVAKDIFKIVHTIEPNYDFYKFCADRFKNNLNVKVHFGNSERILPKILNDIDNSIFWLDGHNSPGIISDVKNCPLIQELKIIKYFAKNKKNILLIDDFRCMLWKNNDWTELTKKYGKDVKKLYDQVGIGWPSLSELIDQIYKINQNYKIILFGDMLMVFDKSKNIKIDKVFNAFMTSILANEKTILKFKVKKAEKIISEIDDEGFICLKEQLENLEKYEHHCYHCHLNMWYGLALLKRKFFRKAKEQFIIARDNGFKSEQIQSYINHCNSKINKN